MWWSKAFRQATSYRSSILSTSRTADAEGHLKRKCWQGRLTSALLQCNNGDTLVEVLAAVVLLGVTVLPFSLLAVNATRWITTDANNEQALIYARQTVQFVRQQELAAYQNKLFPVGVAAQSLQPVRGVQYTETISGPISVPWQSSKLSLNQWVVTVTWTQPTTKVSRSVSLTVVVNPGVASS